MKESASSGNGKNDVREIARQVDGGADDDGPCLNYILLYLTE